VQVLTGCLRLRIESEEALKRKSRPLMMPHNAIHHLLTAEQLKAFPIRSDIVRMCNKVRKQRKPTRLGSR